MDIFNRHTNAVINRAPSVTQPLRRAALVACFLMLTSSLSVMGLPSVRSISGDTSSEAFASETSDAQAALDDAEAKMKSASAECDTASKKVDEIQTKIDETTKKAKEAQSKVISGRETISSLAAKEYKDGSSTLLSLLVDADSFSQLLSNVNYLEFAMQDQNDKVAEQKKNVEAFDSTLSELNVQADEQQNELKKLQQAKSDASTAVSEATEKLKTAKADDAQKARLAALKKQQEAIANTSDSQNSANDDGDSSGSDNSASDNNASNTNSGAKKTDTSSKKPAAKKKTTTTPSKMRNTSSSGKSSGWRTGTASAYGGSSDPGAGSTTANGSKVTNSSMGVAIPMSWANSHNYLGKTVEIQYGGRTVIATVNDVGGMGGGSRALDLQPGVFKALGASTCDDWGLRTVRYRFL